jgi:hypothetical protein
VFERQEGGHRSYSKVGIPRPVVIPTYKEIDLDIIKSNMRTAQMDRKRYFELLRVCKKKILKLFGFPLSYPYSFPKVLS